MSIHGLVIKHRRDGVSCGKSDSPGQGRRPQKKERSSGCRTAINTFSPQAATQRGPGQSVEIRRPGHYEIVQPEKQETEELRIDVE